MQRFSLFEKYTNVLFCFRFNQETINMQSWFQTGFRIRIRMFLPCPDPDPHKFADPGKKVRKWMNKSLFCRVGDVQCKQFHFFCSDFKHPLLRIIWNVKKTQKKNSFFPWPPAPSPGYPKDPEPDLDPDPHEDFCPDPEPWSVFHALAIPLHSLSLSFYPSFFSHSLKALLKSAISHLVLLRDEKIVCV